MSDDNMRNLVYFEASSMRELFDVMQKWQIENQKRFLSTSLEMDGSKLCCIALTNPQLVEVTNSYLRVKVIP